MFKFFIYITIKEYANIISSLQNVPICAKLGSLYNESKTLVLTGNMKQKKRDKEVQRNPNLKDLKDLNKITQCYQYKRNQ